MFRRKLSLLLMCAFLAGCLPVIPATPVDAATITTDWSTYYSNISEGKEGVMKIDKQTKASGTASLYASLSLSKKSMQYMSCSQRMPVEKGHKYTYGLKVKTKNAHDITLKIDQTNVDSLVPFASTSDWKTYTFNYEHKTDAETVNFAIIIEGKTEAVWFDDVFFYDADNTNKENLAQNPSFDGSNTATENNAVSDISIGNSAEALYNALKQKEAFTYDEVASVMGGYQYSAVYPAHEITIDGNGNEWESYASMKMPVRSDQYYLLNKDAVTDNMSTTAEYKFCYDKDNLYVYIEVNDDTHYYFDNASDYWKGDSIQLAVCPTGKTYKTEISFVYNEEENKASVYSSVNTDDEIAKVKLAGNRKNGKTIYEAAIPWDITFIKEDVWTWSTEGYDIQEADKLNEDGLPEKCLLSFLINDNDGSGRAYIVQVDAGGIAQVGKYATKSSAPFPVLELLTEEKDWYAWIEGEKEIDTDAETKFDVYIVNKGPTKTMTIDIPIFNAKETVKIPANSGIRREFMYSASEYGEKVVECTVKAGNQEGTSSFDFYANPAEGYFNDDIKEFRYKGKELSNLLKRCAKMGIEPDYEIARTEIFNKYVDWFEDDLNHGEVKKSNYTIESLNNIYKEVKQKLTAYINGSEKPLSVPKYVTSQTHYNGIRTSAQTELNGEVKERDMFFVGFNEWGTDEHFPFLSKIGFNFSQQETGPSSISQPKTVDVKGWNAASNTKIGTPKHTLEITTEEKVSGNSSLKLTYEDAWKDNLYRKLYQGVACKPNTTYKWGFKAKAINAKSIHASITGGNPYNERIILSDGTYDWTDFDYEYTTDSNTTALNFCFFFMATTEAFYLDDLYIYESGKENINLLENGGFEEKWDDGQYIQYDASLADTVIKKLELCRENNISADMLISPHYFHSVFYKLYPEMSHPDGLMVKYRYDNETARTILAQYMEMVMDKVILPYQDVIGSITLLNEPSQLTFQSGDYYKPHFEKYLTDLYNGDIAELNKIYGTDYKEFSEVPMESSSKPSPQFYDFVKFNDEIGTDFVRFLYEEVKKYTDIPCNTKVMHWIASSDEAKTSKRWLLQAGANPEEILPYSDINGNDSELSITVPFEKNLKGKQLQKSINYDFNRSLKEAPVFNGEDHIGLNGEEYFGPDWEKSLRIEQWMSPFHGRSMTTIWNFDRSRSRNWTAAGIAFRPDALDTLAVTNMDLNRLAEYVYAVAEKDADVGILYSSTARIMNLDHLNSVYKTYEYLLYNGVKPMFAVESQLDFAEKYDTLYLPACRNIERETLDALKEFVDKGGKLIILDGNSLALDGHNQPHPTELVEYVKSKAEVFDWKTNDTDVTMTDKELFDIFDKTTKDKQKVELIDTKTGEKVHNVEYQSVEFKDINGESGVLINIGNYDWNNSKEVKLYIDGKLVEKPFELRSNKQLDSKFTIESYTPIFIKVVN